MNHTTRGTTTAVVQVHENAASVLRFFILSGVEVERNGTPAE